MLGARIAILRRSLGMSQAELARALGISASAVGMYEQGRREPSMEIASAMARIFGVTMDYLVNGKPETKEDQVVLDQVLMERVSVTENRIRYRQDRSFSREEMAVLFAAMLLDS